MSREDRIEMEGVVVDVLRDAFKVKIDDGDDIFCTLSGRVRKNRVRVVLNDKVRVSISPYDSKRGQICYRYEK